MSDTIHVFIKREHDNPGGNCVVTTEATFCCSASEIKEDKDNIRADAAKLFLIYLLATAQAEK